MRTGAVVILLAALLLSWLWFWTALSQPQQRPAAASSGTRDTIVVWVNEMLGSADEAHYYQLADLWNTTEPGVHVKISVMNHAGYESKLRVAIASGQPPDVCFGGMETLESLQYSGKASDLAAPISERYFPAERLAQMGPLVRQSVVRGGHPTVFPIWRYVYGGIILANNEMVRSVGYDDEKIRTGGWTIEQFRDAARRMTRDLDGDGKPDVWGFGAALVHLQHLFMNEFGPGVWGREVTVNQLLGFDPKVGRWTIHPGLTQQHIERVFLLFHQLINVDKSWNPACLGMNFNEILDEVTVYRRLGMTFGETPWVPRLRREIWEANRLLGAQQPPLPELTAIWMPTEAAGQRPVPRAGVMGFSVMKQVPYKGDGHTENAMRFAAFLTHPVHLARSQLRQFRHLPPDPTQFGEIFPELVHSDDPWVRFYNSVMDSDVAVVSKAPAPGEPGAAHFAELSAKVNEWLARDGMNYLQQVIYKKLTPEEGAARFFRDLKGLEKSKN